ncbi:hypothetical protein HU200_059399 [Digitaria exilis]|uniref:DUF1618 domain-containing protein n=1 Tax=Digitaria exilis TaxID=1010633 RepID=A0A835ALB1_9POAL|nr:hypothetical protein HU200_059399 [Digitaria exilis]
MRCYIADLPNATTATGVTASGLPIHVTFRAARPPALSHLCVHCPGVSFSAPAPKVVATHAGVLLLRVPIDPSDYLSCVKSQFWDYYVYTPAASPPRLELLPKRFNDSEAAIVSTAGGGYVVAALKNRIPRRDPAGGRGAFIKTEFELHRYRSSSGEGWVTDQISVEEPVRDALVPLPWAVADVMPYHESGKTVTIGGERGTVAWVDLWRGVILCDVLVDDERPVLRDVPLPVPARGNWGRLIRDGDPSYVRDVTAGRSKGSIKYVEMEFRPPTTTTVVPDSYLEWARGGGSSKVIREGGWKVTTWSMAIPVGSWEDWRRECDVDVGDLTAVDDGTPWVSEPTSPCEVGNLEMVVAVDVRKKTLLGVAELDRQKSFGLMPSYSSSEISSYLK